MSKDEMIEVIATAEGYDGAAVRQEGERFQMPKSAVDKGATWFERFKGGGGGGGGETTSNGPNAGEVIKSIPGLSDEALAALAIAEDDRENPRVSVHRAIEAEQKKRAEAKDAEANKGNDANATTLA